MLLLVILLVVTNLASLGTLLFFLYGPEGHPGPDAELAAALLSKRVLRLVMKSDRQRLREMLNAQELDIAAHEQAAGYTDLDRAARASPAMIVDTPRW